MAQRFERPADIPGLEVRELQGAGEARVCAAFMASSEPWITLGRTFEQSLGMFEDPQKEIYLAIAGDQIAGFAILQMQGPFTGYVQSLGVFPGRQERGVGTRLMSFAEERIFRERPNVFICVSSFNPRARQLYKRLGYEVVGELRDYVVAGHSEILLRKTIGPLNGFTSAGGGR